MINREMTRMTSQRDGKVMDHHLRTEALSEHFKDNIGNRALILVPQFPYLYIGVVLDVIEDQLLVDVERTHIEQLENRIWEIHIDTIHAFFIERDGMGTIPVF